MLTWPSVHRKGRIGPLMPRPCIRRVSRRGGLGLVFGGPGRIVGSRLGFALTDLLGVAAVEGERLDRVPVGDGIGLRR